MSGEIHILVSDMETRFTTRVDGDGHEKVFASLFEAAQYARAELKSEPGWIVICNGSHVNRIPVHPVSHCECGPN